MGSSAFNFVIAVFLWFCSFTLVRSILKKTLTSLQASDQDLRPCVHSDAFAVVDWFRGGRAIFRIERYAEGWGSHLGSDLPNLQVQQVDLLRLLVTHPLYIDDGRHPRGNVLLACVVAASVPPSDIVLLKILFIHSDLPRFPFSCSGCSFPVKRILSQSVSFTETE